MRKLLVYMKQYVKESILGPLFKLLEASFELFVPLVMAAIIDRGIANADTPYILRMGGLLIALALVGLICSITAQWFAARAVVGFAGKLRHEVFARIGRLSYTQLDEQGNSTLITRLTSDINQVQNGVNLTLRLFLRSPFVVFGAMIMAFTIDVPSALVFAVLIPVLCAVVFGIMLWGIPRYRAVQNKLDGVLSSARENLSGVRVIRAFAQEEHEIERFRRENDELTHLQLFVGRVSVLMNPLTYLLLNAALATLIYTGAVRVDMGALTQGQHTVHPVEHPLVAEGLFEQLHQLVNDGVAEIVAPHLVDGGEMPHAQHHDVGGLFFGVQDFEGLKQAVLVLEPGEGIHVVFLPVVVDAADKVIRLALLVPQHRPPAGADHIAPRGVFHPVLHIVAPVSAGENILDALVITLPVIGVDVLLPNLASAEHIIPRQAKLLHGLHAPAGIVIFHIAQVKIPALCHRSEPAIQLVQNPFAPVVHSAVHKRPPFMPHFLQDTNDIIPSPPPK